VDERLCPSRVAVGGVVRQRRELDLLLGPLCLMVETGHRLHDPVAALVRIRRFGRIRCWRNFRRNGDEPVADRAQLLRQLAVRGGEFLRRGGGLLATPSLLRNPAIYSS
jgi:hypothetical protein